MDENTMSRIYSKHAAALAAVAQGERVHLDAARIALALAMHEMNDAKPAVHAEDACIHAAIVRQVEHLLARCDSDLYQRLATGEFTTVDQAIAVQIQQYEQGLYDLRDELINVQRELKHTQMERDDLRQVQLHTVAERDALRQQLAAIHSNGKSAPAAVVVQTLDALTPTPAADNGIDWSALSKEADDYRHGIEAGRWKYGQVPKKIRLELLRCVAAHIAAELGRAPTMAEFDAVTPQWMSLSTSNMQTFRQPWHILIDRNREIEVQP